ncbi:hypothetical protein BV898_18336 [Hypsibius exemplaris]|uniref:Uncharacterized protein n=1 Tax=Hypsibius exemplaris TaxID=2072580 RepID=A0A9X6RNQ4_HYPEX|nr:hypothetical protein BV898_18336 [Hypsibius exemplaris]
MTLPSELTSTQFVEQILHSTKCACGLLSKPLIFFRFFLPAGESKPDKPTTTTHNGQQSSRDGNSDRNFPAPVKSITSAGKQTGNKSGGGGDTSDKCMICKSSKANCNLLWWRSCRGLLRLRRQTESLPEAGMRTGH